MPYGQGTYQLNDAQNTLEVAERQVGVGNTVKFTTLTSCIGVMWRTNGHQTVGVHFVQSIGEQQPIYPDSEGAEAQGALEAVINAYPIVAGTGVIIGAIDSWRNPQGQAHIRSFYNWLLDILDEPQTYPLGDGKYGGRFVVNEENDRVFELLYWDGEQWSDEADA